MHDDVTEGDRQRFWEKVNKQPGEKTCWLWTAKGRVGWGYGSIRIGRDKAATTSQRAGWRIQVGPIPKGQCVLHRCDTPLCVRAAHLFLGSRRGNTRDMVQKARQARGKKLPHAKLTPAKVLDIRKRYASGEHPKTLTERFGVSLRGIWFVIQRKNWGWVCFPGEEAMSPSNLNAPSQKRGYPSTHRVY